MKHILRLLASYLLLASASAADLSITASSFLPSANAKYANGLCGAAISAGALVYQSTADSRYYAADANASAATAKVAGIAGHATTAAGQPIAVIYEDPELTVGATLSTTAPVYVLSATAGGIAPSADIASGWYPVIVGVSISTTKMYFKPRAIQGTSTATAAVFDLGETPRLALVIRHSGFVIRPEDDLALAA